MQQIDNVVPALVDDGNLLAAVQSTNLNNGIGTFTSLFVQLQVNFASIPDVSKTITLVLQTLLSEVELEATVKLSENDTVASGVERFQISALSAIENASKLQQDIDDMVRSGTLRNRLVTGDEPGLFNRSGAVTRRGHTFRAIQKL